MQKRGKKPFLGGIHPTDGFDKALTMEKAVQEYSPLKVTILSSIFLFIFLSYYLRYFSFHP